VTELSVCVFLRRFKDVQDLIYLGTLAGDLPRDLDACITPLLRIFGFDRDQVLKPFAVRTVDASLV
jgi:hypothetical protein